MHEHDVVSREYKVMLRGDRFTGGEANAQRTADAFWRDFRHAVSKIALHVDGKFTTPKHRRFVQFYDTQQHALHRENFILRRRWAADDNRRTIDDRDAKLTLKFRHPDRFIVRDQCLRISSPDGLVTKLEEDIKAPFISFYSFSMTVAVAHDAAPRTLGDVMRVFPAARDRLARIESEAPLSAVGGSPALEVVYGDTAIQIGKKTRAGCALIVWYRAGDAAVETIAVEFSYRYGDENGSYRGAKIQHAYDVFEVLQTTLSDWVDTSLPTKTSLVYARSALSA